MTNAEAPRDSDHGDHLFLEASNRAELSRQRAGDPADAHGIDAAVTPGQWRILPGTDLEVLVVEVLDDEGFTHLVYRRRFDVPNEDHIGGARPGQHYRYGDAAQ